MLSQCYLSWRLLSQHETCPHHSSYKQIVTHFYTEIHFVVLAVREVSASKVRTRKTGASELVCIIDHR